MTDIQSVTLQTRAREVLVNITAEVCAAITASGVTDGVAYVYCPHTSAGLVIQEAADPDVARDLDAKLRRLVPRDDHYHHAEGNSDAHVKGALVGCSQVIPLAGGRPLLGTWQGIFLCEFDGPRTRTVLVKVMAG